VSDSVHIGIIHVMVRKSRVDRDGCTRKGRRPLRRRALGQGRAPYLGGARRERRCFVRIDSRGLHLRRRWAQRQRRLLLEGVAGWCILDWQRIRI
jgi:hypothetical protein